MSISDWSSDVCSSDLLRGIGNHVLRRRHEDAVHHCPLKSRCSLEIDTPENRSRTESFAARNQRSGVFPLRRRTFLAGSFPACAAVLISYSNASGHASWSAAFVSRTRKRNLAPPRSTDPLKNPNN